MSTVEKTSLSPLDYVLWLIVAGLVAFAVVISGTELLGDFPELYRFIAGLVAIAVGFFVFLQTSHGKRFNQFRKDAMQELRRVIWPSRQETAQTAMMVVAVIVLIAVMLAGFDWIVSSVFRLIGIIG